MPGSDIRTCQSRLTCTNGPLLSFESTTGMAPELTLVCLHSQNMLATLANILKSCGVDIPSGRLPPIVWHSPANFVGQSCVC